MAKVGPVAERLAILLDAFSPWEGISLTYRQFAAELGEPVTEAAVKKWPQRKNFPVDIARLIIARAKERGLDGVTLDWVLLGEGAGPEPHTVPDKTRKWTTKQQAPALGPGPEPDLGAPVDAVEPDRRLPAAIAAALRADLSHNEFGQWSSVEVQHTVLWALKDLARRLRVLRFDMGQTFDLTDGWAARIGLPARRVVPSSTDAVPKDAQSGRGAP